MSGSVQNDNMRLVKRHNRVNWSTAIDICIDFSLPKRVLILAGAGSGKTKTLLQKLVYLIEEKGVPASSILAKTFTKNAANEMLDRLILTTDNDGTYHKVLNDKRLKQEQKDQERQRRMKDYKWIDNLTV